MAYTRAGLTPSTAIFIIVFTIMLLFPKFEDPDFYWHLKTGELIVTTAQLPWHDVFTYTNSGHSWVLSEWLSQAIFYFLYQQAGLTGVAAITALVYTLCWFITYKTCQEQLEDEGKAILVVMLFCATMGAIAPRPHIFTFLFFSILLHQLFMFKYRASDRGLIFIPLMMAIWANAHGGFFIGLVLLAAFLVAEWSHHLLVDNVGRIETRRLKKLSLIAIAGFLATAINPHGWQYWLYPYHAIVSSGDTQFISEWQSPSFHKPFFQYFLVVVFLFFMNMIYARKKPDLTELGVSLVFIGGAFFSVRNIPLAALVMAPFFSIFCQDLSLARIFKQPDYTPKSGFSAFAHRIMTAGNKQVGGSAPLANWLLLIASLFSILLLYPSRKEHNSMAVSRILPVAATDFVIKHNISGNMFNTYHYGGYLIYRLYPRQRVFIYGRTDIYPKPFITEYREMYRGGSNWKQYFYKHNIDYVLCENLSPLRQLLLNNGDFKLVFDDGKHSVLLKDTARFQQLIKQYAPGLNSTHDMGSIALSSSNESEG